MSRQFRDDDTSPWAYRYGSGVHGDKIFSSSTTLSYADNAFWNTFSGNVGTTSGTIGSNWTWTGPVLIHQTQGTGAGNWELNYLIISNSTSCSFTLPLQNTYTTGTQIIIAGQYSSVTVNNSVSISVPSWNGSTGGIGFLLCNGTFTNNGILATSGLGYRGGATQTRNNFYGNQGEGYSGTGGMSVNANGNGGGGGYQNDGNGSCGGGGGNANAGQNGGYGGMGISGAGGSSVGNAGLTTCFFGGGGGSGGAKNENVYGGAGGYGGGIIFVFAKSFQNNGQIVSNGGNGVAGYGSGAAGGNGGGGAGGSILIKAQTCSLGSSTIQSTGGTGADSGNGSVGRIHVDYFKSISGSTNPTVNSSVQKVLADIGGAGLMQI